MAKFAVDSTALLYSTHGEVVASLVNTEFKTRGLTQNFRLAGFSKNFICENKVINISTMLVDTYYDIVLSGLGIKDNKCSVITTQQFMSEVGHVVDIKDIKPNDMVMSLNGKIMIKDIKLIEKQKEFLVFDVDIDNSYVNNMVIMPM